MNIKTMDFWIRVNKLLKEKKITQEALCNQLDIKLSTYGGWSLRGVYPDAKQVVDIAKILNTTAEFLVYGYDVKTEIPEDLQQIINKYAQKE